ncbi:3-hydroxyacyl-CoA dehydrogenase [Candidatus Heimdallarchaeota archaeon B3_Heim]|nr:MAG: 3-hydroxyacyl-CoA dehydrogenase [Candidatus Heimdallarchaeota archaeon B3_Heim]
MKIDDIKHVAVIGAGDMGHGIAQVCLMTGYTVSMYDIKDEFVEKGKSRIEWSLNKLAEKARISEKDRDTYLGKLTISTNMEEVVKNADLCVEAAPENLDLKKKIFGDLDKYAPKHAILASNTSNMSITEIGEATKRPDKVAGLHYFNPPVMMQLIEIIKGEKTSDETINVLIDLAKKSTKNPVVSKDHPGFIVNRINAITMLLIHTMLDKKEYKAEEIDAAAMMMGMRMGPYELMDFVGLDVAYHSMNYLADRLDKDYTPTPSMKKLVDAGKLGKKTGEGIYKWPETGRPDIDRDAECDFDVMDLMRVQINEAAKVLEEGIAIRGAKDIDTAMKKGMNNPFGPFELAENADLPELTAYMDGLADKYGLEVFRAHKWVRDGTLMEHTKAVEAAPEEASPFEFENVEVTKDEENFVTTIMLNNPPLNLISQGLLDDLSKALDLLWDDEKTRVIVIRGSANCFSAGAQIDPSLMLDAVPFVLYEYVRKGQMTFKKLRQISKIVIAAMERFALGGGLEMAMHCDLRIAKESCKMGLPEVQLGLFPAWGGTQIMRRHIGLGRTMDLVMSSRRVKAEDAEEMGLITKEVDDDKFEEYVYKYAKKLAIGCAPMSVAVAKRLVNETAEGDLDTGYNAEALGAGVVYVSEDSKEGFMARVIEKRDPNFEGK